MRSALMLAMALATSLLLPAVGGPGVVVTTARADDLSDALADAYVSNPRLQAARRELAARDTLRPQALSAWMPTVTLGAGLQRSRNRLETAVPANTTTTYTAGQRTAQLQVSVNVYRGGSDTAELDRADLLILAQRATLHQVEQEVLLEAAEAVFDVLRDRQILALRESSYADLQAVLRATEVQYRLGERTEADLAQAQSRVGQAEATLAQARANLEISQSSFETLVGRPPGPLTEWQPVGGTIPPVEELLRDAEEGNPTVVSARLLADAAERQIRAIDGERLPTVDLSATLLRQQTPSHNPSFRQDQDQAAVGVQVSVPLYQGGQVGARVREARETESQRRFELENARRLAADLARQARQTLIAATERQLALREAVRAAEVALTSLEREAQFGLRSLIDILNARQELVEAQANLAGAERDAVAGRYRLLAARGLLTAQGLALPVERFDPEENYRRERFRVGPFD